jgi:hypothetical protein
MVRLIDLLNREIAKKRTNKYGNILNPALTPVFIGDAQAYEIDTDPKVKDGFKWSAGDFSNIIPPAPVFWYECASAFHKGAYFGALCLTYRRNHGVKVNGESQFEVTTVEDVNLFIDSIAANDAVPPQSVEWLLCVNPIIVNTISGRLIIATADRAANLSIAANGTLLSDLEKVAWSPGNVLTSIHLKMLTIQTTGVIQVSNVLPSLLMTLSLLNCVNVKTEEIRPPDKLSRAHQKKYKVPMSSYRILTLRGTNLSETPASYKGGTHAAPRQHIVRGHIKRRATGNFYWNSHLRGKPEQGSIAKKYDVKGASDD